MSNRELIVLGTASQVPTRRRSHNGYFLRWDGEGLLFDPGEGTQRQMQFAGVTASHVTRICITHFHGDHCLGLPGVLQRMSLDEVAHEVEVCYPASGRDVFGRLRHAAIYHESVSLLERPVSTDGAVGADGRAGAGGPGFRLEARQLSHGVPTVGYALIEHDGRRMLPGRLAAAGICGPDVSQLQRDGALVVSGREVTLAEMSEPKPGQRFAFIMDTRLCDAAFALAENADLVVCECTFASADASLAQEYGHLTAAQAGTIAAESGARSLVLTHFSQRYDDEATSLLGVEAAEQFGGEVILASDLDRITVPRRRDVPAWSA
ncbi:MAG TPA: ribonuclease Z [Streptosporangiaceae bacterium]|nr:ribonuclease Z [Streptosporangiaceae bacterium]